MKCSKIKKYFFEYYEGLVTPEIKKLVKDHLVVCKDCIKEYKLLQKYKKEMGVLKKVKTPDDFLQKVHARIEQEPGLKKIIKWLFIPFKVKIPLEAVGVVATVLIVILLFSPVQKEQKIMEMAKMPGEASRKTQKQKRLAKPALKRKKAVSKKGMRTEDIVGAGKIAGIQEKDVATKGKKEEMVELVLLIKSGIVEQDKFEDALQEEEADMPKAPAESRLKEVKKVRSEKASAIYETAGTSAVMRGSSIESVSINDIVEKIKTITKKLNGNVINEDYDKNTNLLNFIIVDIPNKNYKVFLKILKNIGTIQKKQVPPSINTNQALIRNKIQFLREK